MNDGKCLDERLTNGQLVLGLEKTIYLLDLVLFFSFLYFILIPALKTRQVFLVVVSENFD